MSEIFNNLIHIARRFKVATFLNMAGLIVAFAAFYLLMTQIIYQVTYNRGIEDYQRIYRLEMTGFDFAKLKWGTSMPPYIDKELLRHPEIESISLVAGDWYWSTYIFSNSNGTMVFPAVYGNKTAISTLTSRVVDGNIELSDDDPYGAVIPASIALQYFGTTHATGKKMTYAGAGDIHVRGVFQDFPDNCLARNSIVLPIPAGETQNITSLNYLCLVKTKVRLSQDQANQIVSSLRDSVMTSLKREYPNGEKETDIAYLEMWSKNLSFQLRPFKDTYFSNVTFTDTGFLAMLRMMELICLLVIVVATVNFVNFTLAESPTRIRGINIRRVVGASRLSLRTTLIAECVVTAMVACLIGLLLCYLLAKVPATTSLVDGNIALSAHPGIVIATLVLAILVGISAGLYPAIFVTSFQPAMVLKSSFGLTPQGTKLRKALMLLQLFVTFFIIVYTSIIFLQFYYIHTTDYGFDSKRILYVQLHDHPSASDRQSIKDEILKINGVVSAAYSNQIIGSKDFYSPTIGNFDGHEVKAFSINGDYDYLQTIGVDIVEGRYFGPDDPTNGKCLIITQATREKWDWTQIKQYANDSTPTLIGVCENIRIGTTRIDTRNEPIILWLYPDVVNVLNVRVEDSGEKPRVKRDILSVFKKYADYDETDVMDLNELLEDTYSYEFRFIRQMMIISLLCMIITFVGVFCLTMFETEYRRKEIAIRKVSGATTGEIVGMLCRHYGWLITIAFAIAAPLAYFIGRFTLEQYFQERTPIHWWVFPVSLLLVGGIILGTVLLQSWLTARENPADSIKSE